MKPEFRAETLTADQAGAVTAEHHIYSEKLGFICRCQTREDAESGARKLNNPRVRVLDVIPEGANNG